jgi:uncharacterized protein
MPNLQWQLHTPRDLAEIAAVDFAILGSRQGAREMNPLSKTDHRPWPVPSGPWIMKQVWGDLLFAHWPLPAATLRPLVPAPLQLDSFGEQAWITIAPFHMSIRARGLPALPGMRRIPELNCRTYVTFGGKPGVFFFSLDAGSPTVVWGARNFYHFPYFYAQMHVERSGETIAYSSRRGTAVWRATYRPVSDAQLALPGTIDYWLTERYCLYTVRRGRVHRGDIHHFPWPLHTAQADIQENRIAAAAGIPLEGSPAIVSFTREIQVLVWPPGSVDS